MYFPRGFNLSLSLELGDLILQAYQQYEAYEKGLDWRPAGGYRLRCSLAYEWSPGRGADAGRRSFDRVMRRRKSSAADAAGKVPVGFVAERRGAVFVIFRGTITAGEWIRNLGIRLTPSLVAGGGKTHEGFLQGYRLVREGLIDGLRGAATGAGIHVAGYSLGAALATLAALDIARSGAAQVADIYTFASPRVGDAGFVETFNGMFAGKSFRVSNSSDLVTSLPLPVPIAGVVGGYFSHVDTPVVMTVQEEELEKNHDLRTYLSELRGSRAPTFVGRLFR
jgi:triacylglycerol lipase